VRPLKPEDWAELLQCADMQELIEDTGAGLEWQNELRNRALMLMPVTGIEVVEG
jgi:hypothetical protein